MQIELYKTQNFRVAPITTLDLNKDLSELNVQNAVNFFATQAITEGVAIEYKENDHGLVLAFVYPEEDTFSYKSVSTRIEDYCYNWTRILEFRACLAAAYDLIAEALKAEVKEMN